MSHSLSLPHIQRQEGPGMNVCILGCGPAGLLSAYAVAQSGGRVTIISKKVKSKIPGAVFLHEPIPYLTAPEPDGVVRFIKHGNKQGYAKKVYGNMDADCSWDLFEEGERPAWSMFKLYDQLWKHFEERIIYMSVSPMNMAKIMSEGFDIVITRIPLPFICGNWIHSS